MCDPSLNNVIFSLDWWTRYPLIWMTWFWPEVHSYSYDEKVSHKNSKLVHGIFSFLKQAVSLIYFLGLLIVIESFLWSWKKGYFTTGHRFKGYRNLPLPWDGVRYNKLSIATGMMSTSNSFFKKVFNKSLFDSLLVHNF